LLALVTCKPYTDRESVSYLIGPEGVASLRTLLRYLTPLTMLVAAPLLGVGGVARAGYVMPASLVSCTPAGLLADGAGSSDFDDMGSAAEPDQSNPDIDPHYDVRDLQRSLCVLPPIGPDAGASSGGAGSQAPSGNAGAGASGPLAGVTSRPETDPPMLVGALFLKTALRRPPPFPSRLFRPPRVLPIVVS
jgi:hypothetical protein